MHIIIIITGAWFLAKAGILDGKRATTGKFYWNYTNRWPEVDWQPSARWVVDGKYWTSSGLAAGLDMALRFLWDYFGKAYAQKVGLATLAVDCPIVGGRALHSDQTIVLMADLLAE